MPDGGLVGDYVSAVGKMIPGSALQGIITDKLSADAHGVASLADIAANPEPWDRDGNGLADNRDRVDIWLATARAVAAG